MIGKKILPGQSIFSVKHIWNVLLFFIIICQVPKAEAQFREIGAFGRDTILPLIVNDTLYASLSNRSYGKPKEDTIRIIKWNGNNWQTLTSLATYNSSST